MKAYTDFKVKIQDAEVAGGMGLEPVMGQVRT